MDLSRIWVKWKSVVGNGEGRWGGRKEADNHVLNPNSHAWLGHHVVMLTSMCVHLPGWLCMLQSMWFKSLNPMEGQLEGLNRHPRKHITKITLRHLFQYLFGNLVHLASNQYYTLGLILTAYAYGLKWQNNLFAHLHGSLWGFVTVSRNVWKKRGLLNNCSQFDSILCNLPFSRLRDSFLFYSLNHFDKSQYPTQMTPLHQEVSNTNHQARGGQAEKLQQIQ